MQLPDIRSLEGMLVGKRLLVRVDLNVPLDATVEHPRIVSVRSLISWLSKQGARSIVLSHSDPDQSSLLHASQLVGLPFVKTIEDAATAVLQNGEALLLENLRNFSGETACDPDFAAKLAELGDIYVNNAFSVSHREHASIVLLPRLLPHYAGPELIDEVRHLSSLQNPQHPLLCILAGAKFDTKLPLIQKFLNDADHVFIGGALANTFFKYQGYELGRSTVEESLDVGALLENKKLLLPKDVVVENREVRLPSAVGQNEKIVDAGPETLEELSHYVSQVKTIIWNGPLGQNEDGYIEGTIALAKVIAVSDAYSLVGGGHTLDVVPWDLQKKFSFVSIGGGAMLTFLEKGTLPGIDALS